MTETILVTGGTGTLGRALVTRLAGHDVRVLSRTRPPYVGNLTTGEGLDRAPVVPVPARTSFQPVDVGEVAERLAYRRGLHLAPEHRDGKITFEEAL